MSNKKRCIKSSEKLDSAILKVIQRDSTQITSNFDSSQQYNSGNKLVTSGISNSKSSPHDNLLSLQHSKSVNDIER